MTLKLFSSRLGVLLAAAVATLGLGVAPAAYAGTPSVVTPGAYCADGDQGKVRPAADGDLYECRPSGERCRWKPVRGGGNYPSPSTSPSSSPSTSPPTYPTTSPTVSPTTEPPVQRPTPRPSRTTYVPPQQPNLPVTGANTGVISAVAAALIGLGALFLIAARRRKQA